MQSNLCFLRVKQSEILGEIRKIKFKWFLGELKIFSAGTRKLFGFSVRYFLLNIMGCFNEKNIK